MIENSVILYFIDGLGIGERDEKNPLARIENIEPLAHFQGELPEIIYDGVLVPTDACLGVEGRPQSASGQTTILTGVNAPQFLGHHKQGFPNEKLRGVIAENSIFLQLKNLSIEPNIFANAYTKQYFETHYKRWKSATTCAVEAAGMPFRMIPDLLGGFAVSHDFTNEFLRGMGIDVPLWTAVEAGKTLAKLVENNRFTLYEHFITDKIGHDQNFEWAERHLPKLAEMIRTVLENINLEKTTFILTSDHGNIEDLSVRNHTLNKVPTIIWGKRKDEIAKEIKDLSDITPAIIRLLSSESKLQFAPNQRAKQSG
jgi:2,3-bisphosphoglycerate-independent phosphoglycerate mutase